VEIFTWQNNITIKAYEMEEDVWRPIVAPDFDLYAVRGRNEIRNYLSYLDPDLATMAPPWTPWNDKKSCANPFQCRRFRRKRREEARIMAFVDEVGQWMADGGAQVVVENPDDSDMWLQPPLQALAAHPRMKYWKVHKNKRGKWIRRATGLLGTKELIESLGANFTGD